MQLAADDGPVEDRMLLLVDAVNVGSPLHEEADDLQVPGDDRQVEQRVSLVVLPVQQPGGYAQLQSKKFLHKLKLRYCVVCKGDYSLGILRYRLKPVLNRKSYSHSNRAEVNINYISMTLTSIIIHCSNGYYL